MKDEYLADRKLGIRRYDFYLFTCLLFKKIIAQMVCFL